MDTSAKVDSIDALKDLRTALPKFAEQVRVAVEEASAQARRAQVWLQREQTAHWQRQIRKRQEDFNQARLVLLQKQSQKTPDGGGPSCVEERKAVELARKRLEEANEKLRAVKLWVPRLEREVHGFKAALAGLSLTTDADVPREVARLDGMVASLEAYVALAPPRVEPASPGPTEQEQPPSMARDGEPQAPESSVGAASGPRSSSSPDSGAEKPAER